MENSLLNLHGWEVCNIKDLKMKITSIAMKDEDIVEIDVQYNKILYKISIMKCDYFPTPKINNYFEVDQFYIEYDGYLIPRLFAKGKILIDSNELSNTDVAKSYKLVGNELINYLKTIFKIDEELKSDLFTVKSITKEYYFLYSFTCLKEFKIVKSEITIELIEGDYILIDYYSNNSTKKDNEIKFNPITAIKKLNQELLIRFAIAKFSNNDSLGILKIVSIEENYYLLINIRQKLYKINKDNISKNYDLNLCKILIVTNYKIIGDINSDINLIELNNNSIAFVSSQDIYFSYKKITLNFYSVIKVNFLDYKLQKNIFNKIKIKDKQFQITKKEMYFVFSCFKINNMDYFPIEIQLISDIPDKNQNYFFILYHGLLNKINAFINFYSEYSCFIEYFFYQINKPLNFVQNVDVSGVIYKVDDFDTFGVENRQRINMLNVLFPSEYYQEGLDISNQKNSFQICKLFSETKNLLFGIFDISEITENIIYLRENDEFDDYYDIAGDILTIVEELGKTLRSIGKIENNKIELIKKKCKAKLDEINISKSDIISLYTFEEEITFSQYKTRLGLLLCTYISDCKTNEQIKGFIDDFASINTKINFKGLSLFQKLRILSFYISKSFRNINIIFFDDLNQNSPYILANNFNKDEINNLDSYSRFFLSYLQFDSFIMYNYSYKENSFSLSLELNFVMKHNLLSNYEDFIFISSEKCDKYAYEVMNEKITVIHEDNLFGTNNCIKYIDDIDESKNKAFQISMEMRHEKNSHSKVNKKNFRYTPYLFCRDCQMQKIKSESNPNKGESGRIIESFLYNDMKKIKELKEVSIYGNLLDYKYYIGPNFDDFKKKMDEIRKENNKQDIEDVIQDNSERNCEAFDSAIDDSEEKAENKNIFEQPKGIEIGQTYFIDDVLYLKLNQKVEGLRMKDKNFPPKYFITQEKLTLNKDK